MSVPVFKSGGSMTFAHPKSDGYNQIDRQTKTQKYNQTGSQLETHTHTAIETKTTETHSHKHTKKETQTHK